jgi:hypothetical protein
VIGDPVPSKLFGKRAYESGETIGNPDGQREYDHRHRPGEEPHGIQNIGETVAQDQARDQDSQKNPLESLHAANSLPSSQAGKLIG